MTFKLGNRTLDSRLIIGSGKFSNNALMPDVIKASGANVVTLALRRVNLENPKDNILEFIPKDTILLPNTSGARNAEEAVRIARLAKDMGCGNWVKVEVIHDSKYLMPDNHETLLATEILAKEGFVVLPYVLPDLIVAKQLVEVGAAAVMPLGSPIGSNMGLRTIDLIKIIREEIKIPVIVDAGIGKPSEAAQAMELGVDAVMVNTAIASSNSPELMAKAFKYAVEAGRIAYEAKLGMVRNHGVASSPLTGFLED